MYIVLAGEVAIFKLRDQEEVMKEEEYHSIACRILEEALPDQLSVYGYASKDLIDSYLDEAQLAKFKNLDHITGSKFA